MRTAVAALLLALAAPASAQVIISPPSGSPGAPGYSRLFFNGASSSNGADTTEDALATCAYTIPAGILANAGDTLHIVAAGTYAGSTDSKTSRVKIGATVLQGASGSVVGATGWLVDVRMSKTSSNNQRAAKQSFTTGQAAGAATSAPAAFTDTATMALNVTGQNNTTATAGSITCDFLTVDLEH